MVAKLVYSFISSSVLGDLLCQFLAVALLFVEADPSLREALIVLFWLPGNAYNKLGQDRPALEFYKNALEIREKVLLGVAAICERMTEQRSSEDNL